MLRVAHRDSPASMSIHQEGTVSVVVPAMAVFSNRVVFDPNVRQNSLEGIAPDLATKSTWSEDGKTLTFTLRESVKRHDGKPFTSADVKCTFELLAATAPENLKVNFRKGWYANVEKATTNGDVEAAVHLKTPQPALLAPLAAGCSPQTSRRSIHAMSRRPRCAARRSAPGRSCSSNTSRTRASR